MSRLSMQTCLWLMVLLGILSVMIPVCGFARYEDSVPSAFRQEELDQMLAPIALYPDSLLIQMLMAATYPVEVREARQWADQNRSLKDDMLAAALEQQNWDASVKSLVNFPAILTMMSDRIDWTQNIGDAFLGQKDQVMATIQGLRNKAYSQGNLNSTAEQVVTVREQCILIEPPSPSVVYVPAYNPSVYGPWWHPEYPPYNYRPPGYSALSVGVLSFGAGIACGVAWNYAWGNVHWPGRRVYVQPPRNAPVNGMPPPNTRQANVPVNRDYPRTIPMHSQPVAGEWRHDPAHRKGMAYKDPGMGRPLGQSVQPGANPGSTVGGMPPSGPNRTTGMQRSPTTGTDVTLPGRQPTDPRVGYSGQGVVDHGRPAADPRPMPAAQNPTGSGRQPTDPRMGYSGQGVVDHGRPVADPRPMPAGQNRPEHGQMPSPHRSGDSSSHVRGYSPPPSGQKPGNTGIGSMGQGQQPPVQNKDATHRGSLEKSSQTFGPRTESGGQGSGRHHQPAVGQKSDFQGHGSPVHNQPSSGRKSGTGSSGMMESRQSPPGQSSEASRQSSTGKGQRSSIPKAGNSQSPPSPPKASAAQPPSAPPKAAVPQKQSAPPKAAEIKPPSAPPKAASPPPPPQKSAGSKPVKNKDPK